MTGDEQIERNKLAAARGWIIQPPPATDAFHQIYPEQPHKFWTGKRR